MKAEIWLAHEPTHPSRGLSGHDHSSLLVHLTGPSMNLHAERHDIRVKVWRWNQGNINYGSGSERKATHVECCITFFPLVSNYRFDMRGCKCSATCIKPKNSLRLASVPAANARIRWLPFREDLASSPFDKWFISTCCGYSRNRAIGSTFSGYSLWLGKGFCRLYFYSKPKFVTIFNLVWYLFFCS